MMLQLSTLSPAVTKLLLECGNAKLKDLMKLTFMDLVLKKVLKIVDVDKKPHPNDAIRTYTYVEVGENYKKYNPKNHELIFLNPFIAEDDMQILFKHLVKSAYNAAGGSRSYRKTIRRNKQAKRFFKESFFIDVFGLTRLTREGQKTQQEIAAYLEKTDNEIAEFVKADQEKALEVVIHMGGNIFLLKNLELPLLKKIDKELVKEKRATNSDSYDMNEGWLFYESFYDDDSFFDDDFDDAFSFDYFDTEFDASDCSSFDSGCSSCSSCSACSGCGGCGGCGG